MTSSVGFLMPHPYDEDSLRNILEECLSGVLYRLNCDKVACSKEAGAEAGKRGMIDIHWPVRTRALQTSTFPLECSALESLSLKGCFIYFNAKRGK